MIRIQVGFAPLVAVATCVGPLACGSDVVNPEAVVTDQLISTTPMRVGRALHTATLLADGRVLFAGGGTPESAIGSAELFDPVSRKSTVIPMSAKRLGHTATLLKDGTVLIVGGGYGADGTARTAEVFDPATAEFRSTGGPIDPRADHGAVLLPSGNVLVLGGDVSGVGNAPTATAELYDPATGMFTRTGSMAAPRRPYGVVLTADNFVLVAGGTTTNRRVIGDAEIYDPATGRFSSTGALITPREKHTATLLGDGTVLLVGGSMGPADSDRLRSSEVYDPKSGRFSAGPDLSVPRHKIVSVALPDGAVFVGGGGDNLAELYDPRTRRFTPITGATGLERFYPAATALGDDRVIISGGYTRGGSTTSAWIFRP